MEHVYRNIQVNIQVNKKIFFQLKYRKRFYINVSFHDHTKYQNVRYF